MDARGTIRKLFADLTGPALKITTASSTFSVRQNFGIPHTFNPDLSVGEAVVAVFVALTRIFLGSLLFALWGVAAWTTYTAIGNSLLGGGVAMLPIAVLFGISLAGLMAAISALVSWIHRKSLFNSESEQHIQNERKDAGTQDDDDRQSQHPGKQ